MIRCIGDSHASFFSGQNTMQVMWPNKSNDVLPYFRAYRIGPATAYQLVNKIPLLDTLIKKEVHQGDTILFCFGEVDCRLHLGRQILTACSSDSIDCDDARSKEVIQECVDRYFNVILHYKKMHKVAVWGPIASTPPIRKYPEKYITGTCKERNEITQMFTEKLEKLCSEENIPFITLFYDMITPSFTTKEEFLFDHIHLSQKAMPLTIAKFKDKGLIPK